MTEPGVRKQVNLAILSAAPVEGAYGPQWKMEAVAEWSKYPMWIWFDRNEGDTIMPGSYPCLIERKELKRGQDGSREYHYNWKGITFNVTVEGTTGYGVDGDGGPSATSHPPLHVIPTTPSWSDENDRREATKRNSIESQTAMNAAVEALKAGLDLIHLLEIHKTLYLGLRDVQKADTPNEEPPPLDEGPW